MLTRVLFDQPRHPVCFSLSTKDRVAYTLEAIGGLALDGAFDLLWFDGSTSEEGQALPDSLAHVLGCLREIHTGVRGGPDFAIFAALHRMLELGYPYCGLIENDVKMAPNWFSAIMATFSAGTADGLTVGGVTGRAFNRRLLYHRKSYAVTMLSGAGMILLTRAAAEIILRNYRTTSSAEINTCMLRVAGREERPGASTADTRTASDLVYETHLLRQGLCILATVPTCGHNLDAVDPTGLLGGYVGESPGPTADDERSFAAFVERCAAIRATQECAAPPCLAIASMGFDCLFLHHLLFTRDSPATIRGRWRIVWDKFNGPFAFEAVEVGCELEFPLDCDLKGMFCSRTADGGIVEVLRGETMVIEADTYFAQTSRDQFFLPLEVAPADAASIRLRIADRSNPASGGSFVRISGLCFARPPGWLPARADLDGKRLAGVLETQSRHGLVTF
ncbi:MAG TPA: hypothetical protein VMB81_28095 [Candidatus Sulfotelmatobacter sp.]|nr:hypothetical protein [Candidatus Sulfotelmatobacter sp.]